MPEGYLALVLHAHLPYVRHPEYDRFLEERWFFEAVTETYIPLVKFLGRLAGEKVRFSVTLSLSPTLVAMFEDALLQERYAAHLAGLIELAERELERTRDEPHFRYLAGMYRQLFSEAQQVFAGCGGKLASVFRELAGQGVIELITTAATHAILPLFSPSPASVSAQIAAGLDYFESVFGTRPRGFWLPECGFARNFEEILGREGVRYFILESHGIEQASEIPVYGVYAPLYTPSGLAAFGRDRGSTKQVWSAREGFPGDAVYREFYRDIGHDLDLDYIRPYIAGDVRTDTGIKYFRITGPRQWKEPYYPEEAKKRAADHAGDFLHHRIRHIRHLASVMGRPPVVVAPFDAELFGHWWFEGPQWLDFLIRKAVFDQDALELVTLSDYLDRHPVQQPGIPSTSTWGHKGYFESWLNEKTRWIWPQLYQCAYRMERLVRAGEGDPHRSPLEKRALDQCLRELLLAQSSDWPFMITNETSSQYALRRVKDHVARFGYLADAIENDRIDEEYLSALEELDNLFPHLDHRIWERHG